MLNGLRPIFSKGRVVKKESLEYLRDFPHGLANIAFNDYSDGILCGFGIGYVNGEDVGNSGIQVDKGAFKHCGSIVVVPCSTVPIAEFGKMLYVKLMVGESYETEDYELCPIEVRIDETINNATKEIELGRFTLNHGAVLRCNYDSFSDLTTPENTLDLTHVPFAGVGGETLHPRVIKEFANALLEISSDPLDVAFAFTCLNSSNVHKKCISWYLAKRSHAKYEELSFDQLYGKLEKILSGQSGLSSGKQRPKRPVVI